jgi:3-oxoacyl-[acyl-carrier-protein] synthase-3
VKAGSANYVLVIGAETLSRIVDWKDRNTCVLFGDGAGAVVLGASDQPGGILASILRADGSGGDYLYVPANGNGPKVGATTAIVNSQSPIVESHFLKMNGREVYKFATRVVDRTLREVMHKVGWVAEQVDVVIPHQANIRILESAMKALGVPMEKTIVNLDRYGNTSAASIPIALAEAAEMGRLRPHDKLLTIGFGGGLTWAAAAIEWGVPKQVTKSQRTLSRFNNSLSSFRSRARKLARNTEQRVKGRLSAISDQRLTLGGPRKPDKDVANDTEAKG